MLSLTDKTTPTFKPHLYFKLNCIYDKWLIKQNSPHKSYINRLCITKNGEITSLKLRSLVCHMLRCAQVDSLSCCFKYVLWFDFCLIWNYGDTMFSFFSSAQNNGSFIFPFLKQLAMVSEKKNNVFFFIYIQIHTNPKIWRIKLKCLWLNFNSSYVKSGPVRGLGWFSLWCVHQQYLVEVTLTGNFYHKYTKIQIRFITYVLILK